MGKRSGSGITNSQRHYSLAGIKGKMSDEYRSGLEDALNSSSNEMAKAVYEKYADQLKVTSANTKNGTTQFQPFKKGVQLNTKKDAQGNKGSEPYEESLHEFAHMIDWLAGGKNAGEYLSAKEVDGKKLRDVLKQDYQNFKKSIGAKNEDHVIEMLSKEKRPDREISNLSDILEFTTGKSYPLGYGHGAKYHFEKGKVESEFFAEVLSSALVNPASYAQLERVFPNSVAMVWKMIG